MSNSKFKSAMLSTMMCALTMGDGIFCAENPSKEGMKFKVQPGVTGSPKKAKMKKVRNFRVVTK